MEDTKGKEFQAAKEAEKKEKARVEAEEKEKKRRAEKVKARWVASYQVEMGADEGKKILGPGKGVATIPRGEAEDSDNWEVIGKE